MRVLVVGPLAYFALVLLLRVSGKRTLSKLNAFDLAVTVALGSTLATIILSKSVPLFEGLAALIVLALLQYAVAFLSVRWKWFSDLVKSEPTLLLRDGDYLDQALRGQRITRGEVDAALRQSGIAKPAGASAVILETDGSMSVLKRPTKDSTPR